MTKKKAERQIEIIKKVTAEICKSKASARQFLVDAGIIKSRKKKK